MSLSLGTFLFSANSVPLSTRVGWGLDCTGVTDGPTCSVQRIRLAFTCVAALPARQVSEQLSAQNHAQLSVPSWLSFPSGLTTWLSPAEGTEDGEAGAGGCVDRPSWLRAGCPHHWLTCPVTTPTAGSLDL